MVLSARRVSATCAATLPLAVLLTGCVSTQTVGARARLVDARIITSQSPTEVTRANPAVSVGVPVVIRAGTATAIVVTLRNDAGRSLTDLPISIGVRIPSGRTKYLNRSANLDYFESHIASIGSRAVTEWVFTTTQHIPRGRPFATVGFSPLHSTVGPSLPSLAVSRARQYETTSHWGSRSPIIPRSPNTTFRSTRSDSGTVTRWRPDVRR